MTYKDEERNYINRLHRFATGDKEALATTDAWALLGVLDRTMQAERMLAYLREQITSLAEIAGIDLEKH